MNGTILPAVDHKPPLKAESREPTTRATKPTLLEHPKTTWSGSRPRRRVGLTTEHVVIDGRNVVVTEDDIGVVELHLE